MYQRRLIEIVDFSYAILRNKINGGRIQVYNESSMQLQLSSILKNVGEMFEYRRGEIFSVELEKPCRIMNGKFSKSGTEKAKIDIFISLEDINTGMRDGCSIELKFFKKENQREPNNRYDVFSDLQNLEKYGDISDVGFMIIGTDHRHYVDKDYYSDKTSDFDIRDGRFYKAGTILNYKTAMPYGDPISL